VPLERLGPLAALAPLVRAGRLERVELQAQVEHLVARALQVRLDRVAQVEQMAVLEPVVAAERRAAQEAAVCWEQAG
jgi:hypothetical protein